MLADFPHQPLGDDPVQRRGDQIRGDAEVSQAGDRRDRRVGVQGAQNQMPGKRGFDGDVRRLPVAHFPHHDHIRVLPEDRPQGKGKGQPGLLIDPHLVYAAQFVFDRVFQGDDVDGLGFDLVDHAVQGGRFSRSPWVP